MVKERTFGNSKQVGRLVKEGVEGGTEFEFEGKKIKLREGDLYTIYGVYDKKTDTLLFLKEVKEEVGKIDG